MKKLFGLIHLLAMACLVPCILSCGKKTEEIAPQPPIRRPLNPGTGSEFEMLLEKQQLSCDDGRCEEYLAKIVIKDNNKPKFCTGFLTDRNTLATATSCLPAFLRTEGDSLNCEKDVFIFFHNSNQKPLRVGCKKIIKTSLLEGSDPTIWREDLAFIELAQEVDRRPLYFYNERQGMDDGDKFKIWSINHLDDFEGRIVKNECNVIHQTYFNPLSSNESSPGITMVGCPWIRGNGGSPIVDYRGKIRGVVSRPIDQNIVKSLTEQGILEVKLNPIIYATNMACAKTIYNDEMRDPEECTKTLSQEEVVKLRQEMILKETLFQSALQKLEASLNQANLYIKVAFEQIPQTDDSIKIKVIPKCFKSIAGWIAQFPARTWGKREVFNFYVEIPELKLKRAMNETGKIVALENELGRFDHTFQFLPREARYNRSTDISVKRPSGDWERYEEISENCSLL